MANQEWTLKRKDNGVAVHLPQDMRWDDEFEWNKVAQAAPQRTLSGGLVIQQGIKANGRQITLSGDWVWLDLSILRTLRDWTDVPELEMTLTHYDGREFNVIWRTHNAALNNVEPVHYSTPEKDSERYTAQLCLMTF